MSRELPVVAVVDDFAFATESVTGPYGITAEIPDMHHVVEWQEFRTIPFQGYYRLILPPVVKELQAAIQSLYKVDQVVMFASAEMALKECVEFLWVEEGCRTVALGPLAQQVVDRISALPLERVESSSASLWITGDPAARAEVEHARAIKILFCDILPEPTIDITYFDYILVSIAETNSPVVAGALLSRHSDQARKIHERNRRRGACIPARDGAWLLHKDQSLQPKPAMRDAVLRQLCALEQASYGALYPSGMCAITVALDLVRTSGKHRIVVVGHPYSDTHLLCKHMVWAGIPMESEMLHGNDLQGLEKALQFETAAVIVETISNPLNEVPDVERIVEICRAHQVPVVVDNTMATPSNCKPLLLGADLVIHSTAKYLNGNNDHCGGVILTNDPEVSAQLANYAARWNLNMSPLEAEALHGGLADFEARMALFNRNGVAVAEWLQAHPAVDEVYYAMLPGNPDHAVAQRLLKGGGSVVSFSLKTKGLEAVKKFYDYPMPLIKKAPSLGSNVTLLCPYTLLTYYQKDDAYLAQYRLDRHLLRLSVGCEDPLEPVLQTLDAALQLTLI